MNESFEKISNQTDSLREQINIFILSFKVFIIISTSLMNGLLIVIFTCLIKKKTISDYLFLSISIADFIIGFIAMGAQAVIDFFDSWPFGKISCTFFVFIQYAVPDITGYALLAISFHRFLQIVTPFRVKENLNLVNSIKLLFPWLFTLIIWIIFIAFLIENDQFDFEACDLSPSMYFIIYKESFVNILTVILILVINIILIHYLNIKIKKFKNLTANTKSNKTSKINKNVSSLNKVQKIQFYTHLNKDKNAINCITALILSVLFTQICYIVTWPIYKSTLELSSWFETFYQISMWLSYCTCFTDPIIQLIFNSKVKSYAKYVFLSILKIFVRKETSSH